MTSDIAPGDVVEAVFDAKVGSFIAMDRPGGYHVRPGDRAIVAGFTTVGRYSQCDQCLDKSQRGILLVEYPLKAGVAWCFCEWRRVGPTKAQQLARFKEDLNLAPAVIAALKEAVR